MLHTEAVHPSLFRILVNLMEVEAFSGLHLVGGTALALQLGHRESVDIDLFGTVMFDYNIHRILLEEFGHVEDITISTHINIFSINEIKVDFVNYRYPYIRPIVNSENIRMASLEDIAAMKINAIIGRGNKKDFIDLYFLLQHFSFEQILSFYSEKFDDGNLFLARKSIPYFIDADKQVTPNIFHNISWSEIKNEISKRYKSELT